MSDSITIKQLDLVNYKGFAKFSAFFSGSTYLVGPNNAGKSTLVHALRGCAHMLDHAYAKSPTEYCRDRDRWIRAYSFPKDDFSLVTENIRHEFSPEETRLDLIFSNNSKLHVVWPSKDDSTSENRGAFFLSCRRCWKTTTKSKKCS
jgi:predicted ATP-dependent endonuclease of OLD family